MIDLLTIKSVHVIIILLILITYIWNVTFGLYFEDKYIVYLVTMFFHFCVDLLNCSSIVQLLIKNRDFVSQRLILLSIVVLGRLLMTRVKAVWLLISIHAYFSRKYENISLWIGSIKQSTKMCVKNERMWVIPRKNEIS